jgi:hypothetical protein
MIVPGQRMPIVIATRPVDFRRGHDVHKKSPAGTEYGEDYWFAALHKTV